jgi:hypothetical protein
MFFIFYIYPTDRLFCICCRSVVDLKVIRIAVVFKYETASN